jgi:hypothetical protein
MLRLNARVPLITAGVLAGALLTTPALAATAKATTSTLKAAKSTVAPKATDTLTGTLKSGSTGVSGEKVMLERRSGTSGTFTVLQTKTTGKGGTVTFSVVPGTKSGQKVQYELVHAANAKYKASHSGIVTVTVK